MEIEKKFIPKYLPKRMEDYTKLVMEQGYLCENPVVRIRKSNADYILTYKSRIGLENQKEVDAKVCHEVELPLTKDGYMHMKEKIDGHIVQKDRYIIPLDENLDAELDLFKGRLEGLRIVEVEFSSEEEAKRFKKPDWFGQDVTLDKQYQNKFLALCDENEIQQILINSK